MHNNRYSGSFVILVIYFGYFYISCAVFNWPWQPVVLGFGVLLGLWQKPVRRLIRKLLHSKRYKRLNDAIQILQDLNSYLNQTIRYSEVRQALLAAFDRLFRDRPWAYYILQNDKYYLVKFSDKEPPYDFPEEISLLPFQKKQTDELTRDLHRDSLIDKPVRDRFLKQNMHTLFLFPGHNRIAALLILNSDGCILFKDAETRGLLEKIQKKAGLILENTALFADLEQRNRQIHKLYKVNEKILSSFNPKRTLDFILISLKSLINYDAAAVFLVDKRGENLLTVSSDGYPAEALEKLHLKIGQGACGWVVQTGKTHVLPRVENAEHYYAIRPQTQSQLSVPLIFNNKVMGVICLESDQPNFFNQTTVETLKLFATQAAIAIHNARQINVYLAKKELEHELVDAGVVQRRLLVQRIPRLEHLQISVSHQPSKLVSGDLYDLIRYDSTTMGVAIGDVSGKGAPAALMMALILASLRSQKVTFYTVCDTVYRLNNLLHESTIEGKYASFFFALISTEKNELIYTNAGHNPPIFIKANGQVFRLEKGGIVLGFLADQIYTQESIPFEQGDFLVAYTDGITEAMNHRGEEFGEERLIELARKNRKLPVQEVRNIILEAVRDFAKADIPDDDMTLVLCKHE